MRAKEHAIVLMDKPFNMAEDHYDYGRFRGMINDGKNCNVPVTLYDAKYNPSANVTVNFKMC